MQAQGWRKVPHWAYYRIFALMGSLGMAMLPPSLPVAGPLADAVGVQPWYLVGGAILALAGLGTFFVPVPVNIEHTGLARQEAAEALVAGEWQSSGAGGIPP